MEYPSLDKPIAGAFRFNTDSSQLEIYDGNQWTGVLATSPEQQTGGTRGMTAAGSEPGAADHIDYWNIATTGNAADFGDRSQTAGYNASTSKEKVVPSPPLKLVITALLRTISSCVKPVTDSPKATSMLNPSLEVA